MTDSQLAAVAKSVDDFHRKKVVPLWTGIKSYIMDVEYVAPAASGGEGPTVRLIELNSFGAEMAAGRAGADKHIGSGVAVSPRFGKRGQRRSHGDRRWAG